MDKEVAKLEAAGGTAIVIEIRNLQKVLVAVRSRELPRATSTIGLSGWLERDADSTEAALSAL